MEALLETDKSLLFKQRFFLWGDGVQFSAQGADALPKIFVLWHCPHSALFDERKH